MSWDLILVGAADTGSIVKEPNASLMHGLYELRVTAICGPGVWKAFVLFYGNVQDWPISGNFDFLLIRPT